MGICSTFHNREEIPGYIALAMIATGGDDHPVMGSRVAGLEEEMLASQKETRLVCGRRRRRGRGGFFLSTVGCGLAALP